MKFAVVLLMVLAFFSGTAVAATLTWTDMSTNERGFLVERQDVACAVSGTWLQIGSVGVNVQTYVDSTPVRGNRYCYRVRAWATEYLDGSGAVLHSGYSNLAGYDYPLTSAPAAPGQLQATGE